MNSDIGNPSVPVENLAFGKIIEVDGTHIVAELDPAISDLARIYGGENYPIGQFASIIKIHSGRRTIYGYVGRLRMRSEYEREIGTQSSSSPMGRVVEADLFGEGEWVLDDAGEKPSWALRFERGVSTFPLPQQAVYLTPKDELRSIYGQGQSTSIEIGEHVGSGGAPCRANLDELLGKHTAVLGSTGAGKSGTVAALLHAILKRGQELERDAWRPQIVILDPHNEYSSAFSAHKRLSTDEGSLSLPYWLLNYQETVSLIIGKTEFVATSQANIIKTALQAAREAGAIELSLDPASMTIDSPVPYRLDVFEQSVESQKPSQASKHEPYDNVLGKLALLRRDARMNFLMTAWLGGGDPLPNLIKQFVCMDVPVCIVDFSGVPNEVAGVASAVIARMLFNVKVWQSPEERERNPIALVCEEAHRYVPNKGEAQYEAAQEAIRRIAKEGRKYGIGLVLVSQRPSEVEPTVLSQCNSWVVLRLTNDKDREHVRSILPDSLAGLTKVLSGLRRREAIFVGQAAMLPSRVMINELEPHELPRSHDISFDSGWQAEPLNSAEVNEIATRWRKQERPVRPGGA
jgi:DNA helicase HerA-like ATPase